MYPACSLWSQRTRSRIFRNVAFYMRAAASFLRGTEDKKPVKASWGFLLFFESNHWWSRETWASKPVAIIFVPIFRGWLDRWIAVEHFNPLVYGTSRNLETRSKPCWQAQTIGNHLSFLGLNLEIPGTTDAHMDLGRAYWLLWGYVRFLTSEQMMTSLFQDSILMKSLKSSFQHPVCSFSRFII